MGYVKINKNKNIFYFFKMCECLECFSINIVNTLLSIVIVLMNGIYAVWGLMLPNSQSKEVWGEYAQKLELYVNVVSYSDAVILPLKIISMILVKWCCCKCEKLAKKDNDICENESVYDSKYVYGSRKISVFHVNP